jgi:hypothetical protein
MCVGHFVWLGGWIQGRHHELCHSVAKDQNKCIHNLIEVIYGYFTRHSSAVCERAILLSTRWRTTMETARRYLEETLQGQWIRRRGGAEYASRSPDLTPPEGCGIPYKVTDTGDVTGRNWKAVCSYPSGHLGHRSSCTRPPNSEVSTS